MRTGIDLDAGRRHALVGGLVVAIAVVAAGLAGDAQNKADWPNITGGDTSTRYSPLDQINASNFNTLKVAWEWGAANRRLASTSATSTAARCRSTSTACC